MREIPAVSPPCPFLRIDDGWASGTFQSEFVEGPVRYLIGVRDGRGPSMQYHPDNLNLQAGQHIELEQAKMELTHQGELIVREHGDHGQVLWSSGTPRQQQPVSAILKLDRQSGQLTIEDQSRHGQLLWDPMRSLREIGYQCRSKDPVMHLSDSKPYLQVKDAGSTLFTTHAEFKHFDLFAGHFIAVGTDPRPPPVPQDSRPMGLGEALSHLHLGHQSAPPLPPRSQPAKNAYLWLDPQTSQLVLHTSKYPEHPDRNEVVWVSPNWKQCQSGGPEPSKATLQG